MEDYSIVTQARTDAQQRLLICHSLGDILAMMPVSHVSLIVA